MHKRKSGEGWRGDRRVKVGEQDMEGKFQPRTDGDAGAGTCIQNSVTPPVTKGNTMGPRSVGRR